MKNSRITIGILGIIILGIILFVLNLFVGSVMVPFEDIFKVLLKDNADKTLSVIIFNYRLPQALTALLAGSALAVAGLLMQTLFRNPLADPSMLGISSGASLGVGIVILLTGAISGAAVSSFGWWSTIGVSLAAFIGDNCVGVASPKEGLFFLYIAGTEGTVTLRYYSAHYKNLFEAKDVFAFKNDDHLGTVAEPFTPTFVVVK